MKRGDRDRFTCNWGHFWHDIKWPGLLSTLAEHTWRRLHTKGWVNKLVGDWIFGDYKSFQTQEQGHRNLNTIFFSFPTINLFSQIIREISTRGTVTGVTDSVPVSHFYPNQKSVITETIMRIPAYRLHRMEPLLLFPPPVQGSRSTWQSGISPRSCSCCSIGVPQSPHRFPLSHELEAQTHTGMRMHLTITAAVTPSCDKSIDKKYQGYNDML